ncbi:MAG TPA: DNA gyrase inhibitor YacG [Steroidobacteraceae bacterium]|nr:DNA gyrase inhibitor YacG [Steroidobacteraceae bacterium]
MSPPRVKCPTCRRELDWSNAPFRPFCSERCRLVDLGAWLSEQRAIPADAVDPTGGEDEDAKPKENP